MSVGLLSFLFVCTPLEDTFHYFISVPGLSFMYDGVWESKELFSECNQNNYHADFVIWLTNSREHMPCRKTGTSPDSQEIVRVFKIRSFILTFTKFASCPYPEPRLTSALSYWSPTDNFLYICQKHALIHPEFSSRGFYFIFLRAGVKQREF
jgi:hypothetical protein